MPDSFEYVISIRRVPDEGALNRRRAKVLEKFEPGSLENLPLDFLSRCIADPRPEFEGCIVLTYTDGRIPDATPNAVLAKTYPTYKNMQGKKVSAVAMAPSRVKDGTVITQTCKNIYCVNQRHITITENVVNTAAAAASTYYERKASGYYDPPSDDE